MMNKELIEEVGTLLRDADNKLIDAQTKFEGRDLGNDEEEVAIRISQIRRRLNALIHDEFY